MKTYILHYKLIVPLLFLISVSVIAQDFKKDYSLVQEAYSKLNKFSCEVKVNMYETENSKSPENVMYSVIKKQADDFWYSMGKIKMVVNDNCVLYIDEDSKQMMYTIRDKKNEMKIPNQNAAAMIDSVVKKSDSVVFVGIKDNCKRYAIYSGKGLIKKTEIAIDQGNYLIPQIVYYYDTKRSSAVSKVVIDYLKMDLAPVFTETDFSEKKYVVYAHKTLKPLAPYTTYKTTIIDQNDFK